MSFRNAVAELEQYGAKVGLVIKLMRELIDEETVEAEVVRHPKQLTNGHRVHRLPAAKPSNGRVYSPHWCKNPECINHHAEGQRGAKPFMPESGRQQFCSKDCRRSFFNTHRNIKLAKRDAKRAKAGLPVRQSAIKRRADPRHHIFKRVACKGVKGFKECGKTFMQRPGHRDQCDACAKVRRSLNVAKGTELMRQKRAAAKAIEAQVPSLPASTEV